MQFKTMTRRALALLAALTLLLSTALTAYAVNGASLDFSKTGSVTLTLKDGDGNPVSGGEITLYQVATLYLDGADMAYAPTEAFRSCTAALDVTDTSLAETLADYVTGEGISGTTLEIGSSGAVSFGGLELGLYLVMQTAESDHYETINPFMVTVPIDENDEWVYDVDANPKVGTVTPTEPEDPDDPGEPGEPDKPEPDTPTTTTTTTKTTTLPQTGQMNWPVPLLGGCGVLLFALGWLLKNTGRKENPR
ncbi:MAG: LPXTG cell wall anchor domain-containing protein [Clostridiales bacterium]|nr:LPXTG cell wall anchor domain-containing protein [Clostridiales bacterium]